MYHIDNQQEKIKKLKSQGERLGLLIKEMKLNQFQFSELIKVSEGYISFIVKGKKPITGNLLLKILDKSKVSRKWLETGEGNMLLPDASFTPIKLEPKPSPFPNETELTKIIMAEEDREELIQIFNEKSQGKHIEISILKKLFKNGVPFNLDNSGVGANECSGLSIHPIFAGCDNVVKMQGTNMKGVIEESYLVGLRLFEDWDELLVPGRIYQVITKAWDAIYYIDFGPDDETLVLRSANSEAPAFKIKKSLILSVWFVKVAVPFGNVVTFF